MDIQELLAKKTAGKKPKAKAGPPDKGDPIDASVTIEDDDTAGTGDNSDDITAGKGTADDEGESDMSSYDDVESSAASDAFDAVKNGDQAGFKTALRDFVEACVKRQTE